MAHPGWHANALLGAAVALAWALSINPAARDRSDEQMAPPRAPDGQAPARPAAVSVLLDLTATTSFQ